MENSLKTTLPSSPICTIRSSYWSSQPVSSAAIMNATYMKNTADTSERNSHKKTKNRRTKSCDHTFHTSVLVTPGQGLQAPPSILNNPTSATTIRVQAEISTRSLTRSQEGNITPSDLKKTKKKSSKRQRSSVVHSRSKSCDRRGENIVSTPSKMAGPSTPRSILDNPTSASSIRVQAEISARSSHRATKSSESRLNNRNFGTPLSSQVPASSLITVSCGKKKTNLGKLVVDWIKK